MRRHPFHSFVQIVFGFILFRSAIIISFVRPAAGRKHQIGNEKWKTESIGRIECEPKHLLQMNRFHSHRWLISINVLSFAFIFPFAFIPIHLLRSFIPSVSLVAVEKQQKKRKHWCALEYECTHATFTFPREQRRMHSTQSCFDQLITSRFSDASHLSFHAAFGVGKANTLAGIVCAFRSTAHS